MDGVRVQVPGARSFGVPVVVLAAALVTAGIAVVVLPTKLAVLLLLAGVVALVLSTRVDLAVAVYVFVLFTEAAHVAVQRAGFTLVAELITGMVLLAHLGDGRAAGRRSGISRALLCLVPFALWSLASFFWADLPGPVLGRFADHVRYIGIAIVLVAAVRTPRTLRFAVWGIVAAGGFLGAVAVLQAIVGDASAVFAGGFGGIEVQGLGTGEAAGRAIGPIGDGNFFAQRMVVVLPFAIERTVGSRHLLARVAAGATVLLTLATIVLTYSRGGALAAAVVVVLCLVHLLSWKRALVLLAVAAAAFVLLAPRPYVDRVLALRGVASVGTTEETSVRGRTSAMFVGFRMFEDHPLTGVGTLQYPVHYSDYATVVGLDPIVGRAPHNLYLEVGAENGLVGLTLLGVMVGGAWWSAGTAMRRLSEREATPAAAMVWATRTALVGYLVASLLLHFSFARVLYALLAICFAAPFLVVAPTPVVDPRRGAHLVEA